MEAATRPHRCDRHFARAPTGKAIQAEQAPGRAALRCAFFGGRFVLEIDGRPARSAPTGREVQGRTVVQHTLDRNCFVFWLRGNTRHHYLPLPSEIGASTVALIAASARSADMVA